MVDVTDIQTDTLCWWYGRQTVDATDIWTDMPCWWQGRWTSPWIHVNHTCDVTPPQSTVVGVVE